MISKKTQDISKTNVRLQQSENPKGYSIITERLADNLSPYNNYETLRHFRVDV